MQKYPLTNDVLDFLRVRRQNSGYIFSCCDGNIIEENKVRRELWRACRRAGITVVGWHRLRHTFASHLVMVGAPLKAIQELLGHADIQTTMRYAHLTQSTLRDVVGLLEGGQYMGNEGGDVGEKVVSGGNGGAKFFAKVK